MKRNFTPLTVVAATVLFGFTLALPVRAEQPKAAAPDLSAEQGEVVIPDSSVEHLRDRGVRMHTNLVIYHSDAVTHDSAPAATWETPASLGCVYGITGPKGVNPCTTSASKTNPGGGSGAIAIVDAYDNPDAATDLSVFSSYWGLPQARFTKVYAQGTKPANNAGGWSLEEALDIEWAHAMAPNAKIILVEAMQPTNQDLFAAEKTAASMVAAAGGGEVSNSWSGSETPSETLYDSKYFSTAGVVYFASAGDSGGVGYPSASPNVISAGGTRINRVNGKFVSETVWNDSSGETGGGPSQYENIPSYQAGIVPGAKRGTPDLSFNASPYSGVAVYDADGGYRWTAVGGTSLSSPALAGIVNAAGHFYRSTAIEQAVLYSNRGNTGVFRDIILGSCKGYHARTGWDYCTGLGSAQTLVGK
ncbi:MAG TPA: S53 family peptidase [Terriglobia bacterium]|nr:S53 family peptidase [Terriglobia bacterium]